MVSETSEEVIIVKHVKFQRKRTKITHKGGSVESAEIRVSCQDNFANVI